MFILSSTRFDCENMKEKSIGKSVGIKPKIIDNWLATNRTVLQNLSTTEAGDIVHALKINTVIRLFIANDALVKVRLNTFKIIRSILVLLDLTISIQT